MCHALLLPNSQRDLHRLIWRENPEQPLLDYRMMRLTFGVSASLFETNMAMKQNVLENVDTHPQAVQVVLDSFYVDDGQTGANSIDEVVRLPKELQ